MRIGVIGLGIIGHIWAGHWHRDGHQVRTWNRSAKPEAPGWTADLLELARDSDLIAIVVADPPAVAQVLERILPAIAPGTIIAQHSTIGVDDTLRFAAQVRAAGGRYLDLPFTGSKPAAEARQNVFFVGDDDDSFTGVEAVYAAISKARCPVGAVGQAMALKLSFNALIGAISQATAESLALAEASGIDAKRFFEVLDLNVAKSGLVDLKKPKWLARDWSPQFSIKHLRKDLRLALALAQAHGLELPQVGSAEQALAKAEAMGLADADFSAASLTVRR